MSNMTDENGKNASAPANQSGNGTSGQADLKVLAETLKGLAPEQIRKLHPALADQLVEMVESERQKAAEAKAAAEKARLDEHRKFAAQQEKALRDELGIGETDDLQVALSERNRRLQELELAEAQRAVNTYIDGEVNKVKYPDYMAEQFREAIGTPATIDEAKAAVTKQRSIFDKMLAGMRVQLKGYTGGVDVLGTVLERDAGVPEYAVAAHFIGEQLQHRLSYQDRVARREGSAPTIQEQLLAMYLEKFDEKYGPQLRHEAQLFNEAEETTDLSLPNSVLRAVIAQVYPRLITPVIFDYQVAAQSPIEIFYEQYVGETGETVTITNEAVTVVLDSWVNMAHSRINTGTVVVQDVTDTTTFVEGTDYVIDYEDGRIYTLSGGSMVAAVHHIDYTYRAFREGEMAAIPRGKLQITSQVLTQKADRLAQQISSEAMTFSRSQLGWDATARTIQSLVNEVMSKVDGDRLRAALNAALIVPSNSGGTWTSATDTLLALVEKVGAAKVKIANRNYEPTGIVVSLTNSDVISNWDGFTAAGSRPGADLNANGYVGRLKGLPVFETNQFVDSHILVLNRELLMQRVFAPMKLKGPYHSTDGSGNLVAAEQWYVEEYNGYLAPVPGKGSYVIMA